MWKICGDRDRIESETSVTDIKIESSGCHFVHFNWYFGNEPSNRGIRYKYIFKIRICVATDLVIIISLRVNFWCKHMAQSSGQLDKFSAGAPPRDGHGWRTYGVRQAESIFFHFFCFNRIHVRSFIPSIKNILCVLASGVRSNSTIWFLVKLLSASGRYERRKSNCYVHFYWKVFIASLATRVRSFVVALLGWRLLREGRAEFNLSLRH